MGVSRRNTAVLLACVCALAVSGCLENSTILTRRKPTTQCATSTLARVAARMELREARVESCAAVTSYECQVRKFGPDLPNGQTLTEECGQIEPLGGQACLSVRTHTFNTSEAARLPGTPAESTAPGGELNRSEYVCHFKDLREGDEFLAAGEGDSLQTALSASFINCSNVMPKIAEAKAELKQK